jgi:hypothetical protein
MNERKTGKKGRKPLSITYVIENEKYLNILFLLYYCMLFRKKQKKKFLKQALIKDQLLLAYPRISNRNPS